MFKNSDNSLSVAENFNQNDPLAHLRDEFLFPKTKEGENYLYFAGHSLGLQPRKTKDKIDSVLEDWEKYAVEGHFTGENSWMDYHESLTEPMAKVVGAKPEEIVIMNTLTANLHFMMVSFYRPTKKRYKILIENNAFPSDIYAVKSQLRFHGIDWRDALIELKPRDEKMTLDHGDILQTIQDHGEELALVMLGNCNYLSGQAFKMKEITSKGHEVGAFVGFDLAHGAGNILCNLHDTNADFAVWCTYKYMNSGPGGLSGAFVNQRHLGDPSIPRFEGWWGQNKATRFVMGPDFDPIPTAEAWQLSNHPIIQLATIKSSLELFNEATIEALRNKGDHLTGYLEFLLKENCSDSVEIMTPEYSESEQTRGNMLCIRYKKDARLLNQSLQKKGAICDFREPDIMRIAPAPLYNNYTDVYRLVEIIAQDS